MRKLANKLKLMYYEYQYQGELVVTLIGDPENIKEFHKAYDGDLRWFKARHDFARIHYKETE